jgi:hypothetical protein
VSYRCGVQILDSVVILSCCLVAGAGGVSIKPRVKTVDDAGHNCEFVKPVIDISFSSFTGWSFDGYTNTRRFAPGCMLSPAPRLLTKYHNFRRPTDPLTSVTVGGSVLAPKTERWAVDVLLLPEGHLPEGPGGEVSISPCGDSERDRIIH